MAPERAGHDDGFRYPHAPDAPTVRWELSPETAWPLRLFAYTGVAALGGSLALGAFLLGSFLLTELAGSAFDRRVLAASGIAVGVVGVAALRLRTTFRSVQNETSPPDPDDEEVGSTWWPSLEPSFVATLVGAGVLFAAGRYSVYLGVALALLGHVAALVAGVLTSRGTLDGDSLRHVGAYREVSLRRLVTTRRLPLGPVVVYWLTYARGTADMTAPRLVVLPKPVSHAADEIYAAAIQTESDVEPEPLQLAERVIVAGFGLGVLATGAFAWSLVPPSGNGILISGYAAGFSLVFSLPILWYAVVG